MNVVVTPLADDECFALSGCHYLHPERFFPSPPNLKVSQLSNMVDFHLVLTPTHFAFFCEDALEEFRPRDPSWGRFIRQDCLGSCSQREAPKLGHKWFLAWPFYPHSQAFPWAIGGFAGGCVLGCHLTHAALELVCKCLEQRCFHGPSEFAEPVEVLCQAGVFHIPLALALILRNDTICGIVEQFGSVYRLAVPLVPLAFLFDNSRWNP
jgi:hypothetical protein